MHLIYKQDLYKDKQRETYELCIEYLVTIIGDINHPEFIAEWKQNLDAEPRCKDTIN